MNAVFENFGIDEKCNLELSAAVKSGKLSHAVILEGADENTRLACAKMLAKAILCKGERKPCGVCPSCIKAQADSHPDIHFIQKSDGASTIKIDEIRQMKKDAALLPNDSDKCVFIISEAQDMGIAAQNALLKTFEEPASHVSFILTCSTKSAFLETVISRASLYCLCASKTADAQEYQQALSQAENILAALCRGSEYELLCLFAQFQKDKEQLALTLDAMASLFADALVIGQGADTADGKKTQLLFLLSSSFSAQKLMEYIEAVNTLNEQLKANANYNLLLTRLCSKLYEMKHE